MFLLFLSIPLDSTRTLEFHQGIEERSVDRRKAGALGNNILIYEVMLKDRLKLNRKYFLCVALKGGWCSVSNAILNSISPPTLLSSQTLGRGIHSSKALEIK